MDEDLIYSILEAVQEIPYGKVATYGQIATLSGNPGKARLVGKVLSHSTSYGTYPCHRVVNGQGRLAPHWLEQAQLLQEEGVTLNAKGKVDLKHFQWTPSI